MILVGGPAPRQNGKIMTYMYDAYPYPAPNYMADGSSSRFNCGKSLDGQDFQEFLGKDGYDDHIIMPFNDFLHKVFRK